MFDAEHFRQIERAHRFHYPRAFWKRWPELTALVETEWFRATYPGARLIGTQDEIEAVRRADPGLPDDLVPFLVVSGQAFPDYYGFQTPRRPTARSRDLPVLVWCIHAYVDGWDAGFGAFLDELQSQRAGRGSA